MDLLFQGVDAINLSLQVDFYKGQQILIGKICHIPQIKEIVLPHFL